MSWKSRGRRLDRPGHVIARASAYDDYRWALLDHDREISLSPPPSFQDPPLNTPITVSKCEFDDRVLSRSRVPLNRSRVYLRAFYSRGRAVEFLSLFPLDVT